MKNVYLAQMSLRHHHNNFYNFPYSIGVVWAYTYQSEMITDSYTLKELFLVKEPINDIIRRMEDPAIIGISNFVWNTCYSMTLAEEMNKYWPNYKVIAGGSNVPDSEKRCISREHP